MFGFALRDEDVPNQFDRDLPLEIITPHSFTYRTQMRSAGRLFKSDTIRAAGRTIDAVVISGHGIALDCGGTVGMIVEVPPLNDSQEEDIYGDARGQVLWVSG